MKKFEYDEHWFNEPLSAGKLTYNYGEEGWELCGIIKDGDYIGYYFKREIIKEE